ncbi:hypothetical protein ACJX0J_009090, partial [Zea mays]
MALALDWFGTFSLYTTQHKMHKSNSKEDDHINKRNQAPINYQNIKVKTDLTFVMHIASCCPENFIQILKAIS